MFFYEQYLKKNSFPEIYSNFLYVSRIPIALKKAQSVKV